MHLILAPLRGFTDVVFRNAFARHFNGIDEAVAPFVTSTKGRRIKPSHLADLVPAENSHLPVVPQILSNNSAEFLCLANTLVDLGYGEINWNIGCPYPMVAKKKRGSGLLPFPDEIDRLLERVLRDFAGQLSIKTRLGRYSADEINALVPVFNRYPVKRIIIHPRTGVQMYTGSVDLSAFERCLPKLVHPVVYNGDINRLETLRSLSDRFPSVSTWMLGRGLVANPFLAETIRIGSPQIENRWQRFADFHDALIDGYTRRFSGPGHVLARMKGFWGYFADEFVDGRRILKKIRKTTRLENYRVFVDGLLDPRVSQGKTDCERL
ncbi:tRNA-dihydrouridine synthase [Desulfosarcina ovata subsp. sediminis]|uniref:tRNA-dihydrouridine synthase n=1 Tax=Desulfosarcina ovata subsp. sediminis TaxID=885957 RepID=A0A5K7ZIK7_9BACT|nr:tRNA-dihydrouridine synthase family protein [Desulfosarcina ovata]BBO80025.1 tRNA-dihydrouridine synthase [Desulfosarcina ovata subsp. sediminis]